MHRPTIKVRQSGATLVELIVSIVVIGVGLAGVLIVMDRNTSSSADPMLQHQAVAIAEAYLEEILLKPFDEPAASGDPEDPPNPGPDAGETDRSLFDDVNDYHNLANNGCITTTAACPVLGDCPCNQDGDPIAGLKGYTVTVQVDTAAMLNGLPAERVQVDVNGPFGVSVTLSGYRTNY